jgi:sugar phosphate isomerase/epimerase
VSRIGLMLYTVREDCARDLGGTLGAVASLGYEGVELARARQDEPARVVRVLADRVDPPRRPEVAHATGRS